MKYYRKKERNYNTYNIDGQPCWTCKNACGGCIWSREFKPVPGWKAEPTIIPGHYGDTQNSYKITYCPEYLEDKRI